METLNDQLVAAVRSDDIAQVKYLVENQSADVNCQSGFPLRAAIVSHSQSAFDYLLSRPEIKVNIVDAYAHCTPLHTALLNGQTDMALQIVARDDADLSLLSFTESTALAYSIYKEQHRLVADAILEKLKTSDADKHPEALNWAVRNGDEELVKRLLSLGFDPTVTAGQQLLASLPCHRERGIKSDFMDDEYSFAVVFSELDKTALEIAQEYALDDIEDDSTESINAQQNAMRIKELLERHTKFHSTTMAISGVSAARKIGVFAPQSPTSAASRLGNTVKERSVLQH